MPVECFDCSVEIGGGRGRQGQRAEISVPLALSDVAMVWKCSGNAMWECEMSSGFAFVAPFRKARAKRGSLSKFAGCESGGAIIEFAIVMTVFMLFVAGILSFGLYLGVAHSVQQLAADTARASVAGLSDAERTSLALSHVDRFKRNYPLLAADKISVDAHADASESKQFNVVLRYDAEDLPIWMFAELIPLPPKTIVRTSSIMNGGF